MHFFAVTVNGTPRGCGAIMLRAEDGGYAEVKRIFVSPAARGLGLGRKIIAHLEATTRAAGLAQMRLETGPYQPEALALFAASGFVTRGHFGDYPDRRSALDLHGEAIGRGGVAFAAVTGRLRADFQADFAP